MKNDGKAYKDALEQSEREKTGISNLKPEDYRICFILCVFSTNNYIFLCEFYCENHIIS